MTVITASRGKEGRTAFVTIHIIKQNYSNPGYGTRQM